MEKIWRNMLAELRKRTPAFLFTLIFYRYLAVGLLNTVFGYGVFALLIYLGLSYPVALFLATILGVLFNFKSIGVLVFKSRDNKLIFRFVAVYIVIYFLNLIGLKLLTAIDMNVYYSGAVLLPLMAVVGFIINKRFVFNNE